MARPAPPQRDLQTTLRALELMEHSGQMERSLAADALFWLRALRAQEQVLVAGGQELGIRVPKWVSVVNIDSWAGGDFKVSLLGKQSREAELWVQDLRSLIFR